MKEFTLCILSVMLVGIGCTETQKQQVAAFLSTNQSNTNAQSTQQPSVTSSVKSAVREEGDTPLIIASRQGELKTVQALLAGGADVNATNAKGFTALMVASQEGHADVIKALATNKKLDLEAINWNGDTALLIAVQNDRPEAVRTLLALGANPNYAKAGMTILIAASYKGNPNVVRALLDAGADASMVDENNETALDVAINANRQTVITVLREYQSKNKKM